MNNIAVLFKCKMAFDRWFEVWIAFQGWFEMQINTKCSKIIWIVSKLQVGCLVRQVTFGGLTLAEQYLWLDGLSSLIWRGSNIIALSIPQYQYQPQTQNTKKETLWDFVWLLMTNFLSMFANIEISRWRAL